jgi:histidinol-phosphate aminotransferase
MVDKLVSKIALELQSYKVEPKVQGLALDKNEMPWSVDNIVEEALIKRIRNMEFNRYPDNDSTELKTALSSYTGIDPKSISIGNGSDELIHMTLQAFVDPGDAIVIQSPTFSMYKIYGTMCGARVLEYNLDNAFGFELSDYIDYLQRERPKLVILCNPNNPTGRGLGLQAIEQLLEKVESIILVDEAYFEFSGLTAAGFLSKYDNLIILRTFSKAFGIASSRVGYMLASPAAISFVERTRPPFNVNTFAQITAVEVLKNIDLVKERIELIKGERKRLTKLLTEIEELQCFESSSNFILMKSKRAGAIYKGLYEEGIYIKSFSSSKLKDCLRVTIGSKLENDRFYKAVKEVLYESI